MANNAYKITICDDNPADAAYIENLVYEWAGATAVHVEAFTSAEEFLFRYAEDKDFDILLLDVEMGGMDGVTMAKTAHNGKTLVSTPSIT